jgi:hypothetical protein
MKPIRISRIARAFVSVTAVSVLVTSGSIASAASKSINCYKGTAVKKVTAASPKCPTGWTTKKPTATATPKPSTTPTTKPSAATVAFSGTYKGKIALLWSDSDVRATSVSAAGTGTISGLDSLTGSGSAAPQNQCDGFDGSGVFSGSGNTLKVTFDSTAKACAEDGDAPTTINITGNATISGGTGKFAGATGTLKVTGSFAIKSKAAGFGESAVLTLTLIGNINTK